MSRNTRSLAGALLSLAIVALPASAQRKPEPTAPNFKKLTTIDSASVPFASISPNGRWVAFVANRSIWIAGTDGRSKPQRLTSPGHRDQFPYWFMSSDALTFTSDRVSRGDATKSYGMTIAIDPQTGRAVGPPRAVTTEPVSLVGYASPDGKWIAYTTESRDSVKVVPVTGGTPRLVATTPTRVGPVMWRNDGKTLVFGNVTTWYTVPATGGTAVPTEHAPFFGDLHLHGPLESDGNLRRMELRDSTERVVRMLEVPADMGVRLFNYTTAAVALIRNATRKTHVYTLANGAHEVIDAPMDWSDGWSPDGNSFVADRVVDGKPYIGALDRQGRFTKQVALPADARSESWEGVVGMATTFRRGNPTGTAAGQPAPLYVADVTTGAIRQLVSQAYESRRVPGINVALTGAGGDRQDGDHFVLIAPNGTNVDVERVSLDGKAEVARTFSFADSVRNFAVNGSRVAWSKRAGDSLIIFAASGPGGAAHRVTSVPAAKEDIELAWSRRGDQLAMVNERGQATITIVKVSENGAPVGAPTILRSRALEAWSLRWAADDKLLVMIAYEAGNQDGQIAVVPVNPEEPQRMLTSGEDASDDWLKISPDGKRVMFPEAVTTGTSIWRADFVPVKGSPRAAKP